jgi:hypothetical protein
MPIKIPEKWLCNACETCFPTKQGAIDCEEKHLSIKDLEIIDMKVEQISKFPYEVTIATSDGKKKTYTLKGGY